MWQSSLLGVISVNTSVNHMRGLCCAVDITDGSWCVTSFVKQRRVLLGFVGAFSLQEQLQHLLGKCPGLKSTEIRKCLCFPR